MLHVSSASAVAVIADYLKTASYDVEHLSQELHLSDGLFANLENLDPLLAKTEGDYPLALLARLFFVSWPVNESLCRTILSDTFLQAAFDCGLLVQENGSFAATACVLPFRGNLVACDSSRTRSQLVDMVTGPSATTMLAARLAIPSENETTLDLGTGTGVLALEAAHRSHSVVGTDINPRTLAYAEFNAALNSITNIEWLCGDSFTPVEGRRFSRIIANPPFFLSPAKTFTYCDSPLELDGFTANLARHCSAYLEEGGYYQMICEWVELEHQPWEDRLRDWTADSGCDVLILLVPRLTPLEYAEKRTKEARLMQSSLLEHSFSQRLSYLTGHGVKHVFAGIITMRKRSVPDNWFVVTATDPIGNDVGIDIKARFDAHTFLATSSEEVLLASRFRLAEDVVLDKRARIAGEDWRPLSIDLVKLNGLPDRLRLDETVAGFLPLFDGHKTLSQVIDLVSAHLGIEHQDARHRCLQLARRLLQSNFVR